MVCLVSKVLNQEEFEESNTVDMDENDDVIFDDNFDDDHTIVPIAAGTLTEHEPLFTPDGKNLLVIYRYKVIVYSALTGEWVRDFDEYGKSDLIYINICLHNPKILIGCSKKGDIVRWEIKNGKIQDKKKLPINSSLDNILSFALLKMYNKLSSLVVWKNNENKITFDIIDMDQNTIIKCPLSLDLGQDDEHIMTAADTNNYHYFVIAQKFNILVVDYKTWRYRFWKNAKKEKITVIKTHPSELAIATGDETGKIFLYRNLFKMGTECHSTLYHWHHTKITSIAFTLSGTGFYSGGLEGVLVKWTINNPHMQQFLPRLNSQICQVAIGDHNKKIAISTAENSIQIIDDQFKLKCVLQYFTFIFNNKSGQNKFPVGLKLNPVNNTLALNGRCGHLQFFSTYTKSLLYNIDIVMQNKLSVESGKTLYDIVVTNADFNINWMVTGEMWDDIEHPPELRIKFWEYIKEKQNYTLSTCIETPHEVGIKSLKFSKKNNDDGLLCASLGNDNFIKIWSLEIVEDRIKDQNIIRKYWECNARTKYKNYEINSISFSIDGSILTAGFGNTLCIYEAINLKLKAVLTPPSLYDGSAQKIQIYHNEKTDKVIKSKSNESYKKILDLFKNFEENIGDKNLVKFLQNNTTKAAKSSTKVNSSSILQGNKNKSNSELLFNKILQLQELNLFQKLLIFQKINLHFSTNKECQPKLIEYINKNINKETKEKEVKKFTNLLSERDKFKAKYKLKKYQSRKNLYQNQVNEIIAPMLSYLKLEDGSNSKNIELNNSIKTNCNGYANGNDVNMENHEESFKRKKAVKEVKPCNDISYNLQNFAEINHICFGKAQFAHLVIVATENRIIIWNILTLRIEQVLKLSTKLLVIDDLTSLCAVVTNDNELYVFLPNQLPLCIYTRSGMPDILSACWTPRKYPISSSLDKNWQSFSILYFLTEKQEIVYLSSNIYDETKEAVTFVHEPSEILRNSIFDVHNSKRVNNQTQKSEFDRIGVPRRSEIKSIIHMAPHASAPMSHLSGNFIKSLLYVEKDNEDSVEQVKTKSNKETSDDSDSDNDEIYKKVQERKRITNEILSSASKELKLGVEKNKLSKNELKKLIKEQLPDVMADF